MKIRFLLDENLSPRLKPAVLRLNPEIDILRIGEPATPSLGTLDPDVLNYLESSQRLLVTNNRNSMPGHLEAHWAENKQIWGLFWIRPDTPLGVLAQELCMIWETSEAEEWINNLDWIPF
jgi:Domain of unknown function (DUF5615)